MLKSYFYLLLVIVSLAFVGCKDNTDKSYQFELLIREVTHLDFENTLTATEDFNIFSYMYFYNGAGIGAGDFNNDGRVDLYFASNMGENKLFLNTGNLKFADNTEESGLAGETGWSTGISIVDINGDGLLDIYVCQVGNFRKLEGKNRLYVNQGIENGIPKFKEEAADYGLDFSGFSTQAVFFDYDMDGDLDMFLLNHSVHENGTFGERSSFLDKKHPTSGDRLYRNDKGKYSDVTNGSGIESLVIGYGLGVATGDINNDGWPDIYVGNDFHENDYLYINQRNGTFHEMLNEKIRHTSRFSMGVDIADINNDGFDDIISLDMQPYDPHILKSSLGEDDYSTYNFKLKYGYNFQFARNNLQLNNGDDTFSEIGMFADVSATDWSWAPLFFDFNHDGYKDLFVSNGIPRRMNDIDYANYREEHEDFRWKTQANRLDNKDLKLIELLPEIKIANKLLLNDGHLKFKDFSSGILHDRPSYSNGAIYADLDNDGDLDAVVNNINEAPFIYRNLSNDKDKRPLNHFLNLEFKGSEHNINGVGARVIIFKGRERITYENFPVRGFQSSAQTGMNIGIGNNTDAIDSVLVIWPDMTYEKLSTSLLYDSTTIIKWSSGLPTFDFNISKHPNALSPQWEDLTQQTSLNYIHEENPFIEFDRERLIPFMVSREGPAVAVGDINGDGLDDIFFGSAKRKKSAIYFQQTNGKFILRTERIIENDSIYEDVDARLADIDNDGDADLIVASGGNEFWGESEYLKPRIYINGGNGRFDKKITFNVFMTASCVLTSDFNNDGLIDIFFGGRAVPNNYGKIPRSYLFQNMGEGEFRDVTDDLAKGLSLPGMIKSGQWVDIDNDGDDDLILAVEWGPVKLFVNKENSFEEKSVGDYFGWWSFIIANDFDGDGDIDIIAGNTGENAKFKPTVQEPVKLYVNDFDGNGQTEQIMTYYLGGKEIPFANYYELTKQLPYLRKNYQYASDFAVARIEDMVGKDKLSAATLLKVNTLSSAYFENEGNFKFKWHSLPQKLQFAPIMAGTVLNVEKDSSNVFLAGNFFDSNIEMGKYDASYGDVLSINKRKEMNVRPLGNIKLNGQIKHILPIMISGKVYYVIARNNDSALIVGAIEKTKFFIKK